MLRVALKCLKFKMPKMPKIVGRAFSMSNLVFKIDSIP